MKQPHIGVSLFLQYLATVERSFFEIIKIDDFVFSTIWLWNVSAK